MKNLALIFFIFLASGLGLEVAAINSSSSSPTVMDVTAISPTMTVNDFLAVDIKGYRTAEGKKMKWTQRLALNMTQKNLEKKVKRGKIDGEASLSTAVPAAGSTKFGLLSVIFSVAGLVVPYFGLAMIVAGLVLGIIGIRRDADPTLAIIGTVISGLFLLLILIALVALASGAWWF